MTRRKRETSEDEKALFHATFAETRPLDPGPAKKPTAKVSKDAEKPARQKTQGRAPGLDGRTAERLRRGQLEPQSRLDLHGMTEAAAHRSLARFLRSAQARGERLVLVVTGKGARPAADDEAFDLELDRRSRGVLKTMVPRWLEEADLAPLIASVRTAHRRHGGEGALYVYLKRSPR